jgi:hypothetical protein
MAYATVAHVREQNFGREITGNTEPSATQVVDYLEHRAGILDSILGANGYEVPIPTGATSAFLTIQRFNALGAAYDVEMAARTSDRRDETKAMWESALKMLQDGVIELDAPRDTETSLPRSSFDGSATPFFTRDQEF